VFYYQLAVFYEKGNYCILVLIVGMQHSKGSLYAVILFSMNWWSSMVGWLIGRWLAHVWILAEWLDGARCCLALSWYGSWLHSVRVPKIGVLLPIFKFSFYGQCWNYGTEGIRALLISSAGFVELCLNLIVRSF